MTKQQRIRELSDQLNELQLPSMAASLDSLFHSKDFDTLDRIALLEQLIEPEYQAKTSQKFQNRLKRAEAHNHWINAATRQNGAIYQLT